MFAWNFAPDYFPRSIFHHSFPFSYSNQLREKTLLDFYYALITWYSATVMYSYESCLIQLSELRFVAFDSAIVYQLRHMWSNSSDLLHFFTMLIDWFIIYYHSHFHCYSIVSHQDLIVSLTLKKIFLALWSLINRGLLTMDYWPLLEPLWLTDLFFVSEWK